MSIFLAKFNSICYSCGRPIRKNWDSISSFGQNQWVHENCLNKAIIEQPHYEHPTYEPPVEPSKDLDTISIIAQAMLGFEHKLDQKLADKAWEYDTKISRVQDTNTNLASLLQEAIGKLEQSRKIEVVIRQHTQPDITFPSVHKQFADLLQVVSTRTKDGYYRHAYLFGAPGGGKSTAARQVAEALSLPFYYYSLDDSTQSDAIMGYNAPNISTGDNIFHSTDYFHAYKDGGLVLMDEMDNTSGNLLTSQNTLLENGWGSFPCGMTPRHPDFLVIGCGNTTGQGGNTQHASRQVLDFATRARFAFMEWKYDWDMAKQVCNSINPASDKYVEWCRKTGEYVAQYGIRVVLSPREAIQLSEMSLNDSLSQSVLLDSIMRGLDKASVDKILANYPFPRLS